MDDVFVLGPFLIPITAIIGSFIYIIIKTLAKARVRELEIRERIAMIERGLVPPPEVDPRGFDRAMDRVERLRYARHGFGSTPPSFGSNAAPPPPVEPPRRD